MVNRAANEKGVALVIGNAAYSHAGALANPANDARGITKALTALGLVVATGIDLARDPMENAFFDFETAIREAEVALLFYAGHGLQVKGENYLIPVDANIEMEMHLKRRAFSLSEVLGVMSERPRTNLIFLDACRNNPFTRLLSRTLGLEGERALRRGLAEVRSARGTFIAFATAPNEVAFDGKGKNSPFTAALLKHIGTPGLSITDMMTDVINEVAETTGDKQQPWRQVELAGQVLFDPVETTARIGSEPALAVSGLAQIKGTGDVSTLISGTSEVAKNAELGETAHTKAAKAEPTLAEPATAGVVTPEDLLSVQHDNTNSPLETLDEIKVSLLKAGREVYFSLKPGETFRDLEIVGPEMVIVPPGEFMMGSREGEGSDNERPQHRVTIPRALAVSKYPVTYAEWEVAIALGGAFYRPPRFSGQVDQMPVRGVSWDDINKI